MVAKSVKNNEDKDAKKRDIIELIRASSLSEEVVDLLIPPIVTRALSQVRGESAFEDVIAAVKESVLRDEFLEKFVHPFEEIFSHDEVKVLVQSLKSKEMRKFYATYTKTTIPMVPVFLEEVEKTVYDSVRAKKTSASPLIRNLSDITRDNFQREVEECKQPIVLSVYSDLCGSSKLVNSDLSGLKNKFSSKIKFIRLNIDQEFALSQELGVRSIPTLLFFQKGEIIDSHEGIIDKKELTVKIEEAFS